MKPTNRTLKVTSNKRNRTFTLRFYYPDGTIIKYRTLPMIKKDFEQADYHWTENDWKQFLKTDGYYAVK